MGILDRFKVTSRRWAKTIVAFESPPRLREVAGPVLGPATGGQFTREDQFKIRLAHNDERTRDAKFFVEKRYGEAGYHATGEAKRNTCPDSITLATYHGEQVIGTMTLGFDVGSGLVADELYKVEIDQIRARGASVAEITRFALDTKLTSKRFLAAMFNVAYIYLCNLWNYTDLVIEVHPDHAPFYVRMLGFAIISDERLCPRVEAPAILLWLNLVEKQQVMRAAAGKYSTGNKTLYPYFFPAPEEARITDRLLRAESD